jgi:shikimate kinase
MNKTVIILIGCKGSGKTYIGSLVEKHTDIVFLRVEPIWLTVHNDDDGWLKVEAAIDEALIHSERVMIETLGVTSGFDQLRKSLSSRYIVKYVHIIADLDVCLGRVINRDTSNHIPISDDKVHEYNKIAARVELDWSLTIDNNKLASDSEILQAIASL